MVRYWKEYYEIGKRLHATFAMTNALLNFEEVGPHTRKKWIDMAREIEKGVRETGNKREAYEDVAAVVYKKFGVGPGKRADLKYAAAPTRDKWLRMVKDVAKDVVIEEPVVKAPKAVTKVSAPYHFPLEKGATFLVGRQQLPGVKGPYDAVRNAAKRASKKYGHLYKVENKGIFFLVRRVA